MTPREYADWLVEEFGRCPLYHDHGCVFGPPPVQLPAVVPAVPEPRAWLMMALGCIGVWLWVRMCRRAASLHCQGADE